MLEERNIIKITKRENIVTVFVEKKSKYKWTCAVQNYVVQGSTVISSILPPTWPPEQPHNSVKYLLCIGHCP